MNPTKHYPHTNFTPKVWLLLFALLAGLLIWKLLPYLLSDSCSSSASLSSTPNYSYSAELQDDLARGHIRVDHVYGEPIIDGNQLVSLKKEARKSPSRRSRH